MRKKSEVELNDENETTTWPAVTVGGGVILKGSVSLALILGLKLANSVEDGKMSTSKVSIDWACSRESLTDTKHIPQLIRTIYIFFCRIKITNQIGIVYLFCNSDVYGCVNVRLCVPRECECFCGVSVSVFKSRLRSVFSYHIINLIPYRPDWSYLVFWLIRENRMILVKMQTIKLLSLWCSAILRPSAHVCSPGCDSPPLRWALSL